MERENGGRGIEVESAGHSLTGTGMCGYEEELKAGPAHTGWNSFRTDDCSIQQMLLYRSGNHKEGTISSNKTCT